MKIPTTFAELEQAANLPLSQGNALISQASKSLVESWGQKIYSNWGQGYLHSSDHEAALIIILGREPAFREVYDSWHSGSKNIDLAYKKSQITPDSRPQGWDDWTDDQKRYGVLRHLYGITAGSRIYDGRKPDPSPEKTRALMVLWGLRETEPQEPEKPIYPPTEPKDPTEPTPKSTLDVELKVNESGTIRTYRGVLTRA